MMRCRTCSRRLEDVRVMRGRWVAVCPGCADRNELRCPGCRGPLDGARETPRLEAFCARCERSARIVDGRVELGEPRTDTPPPTEGRARVDAEPPLRPLGRSLSIRRRERVRDAGFREPGRAPAFELERAPRPKPEIDASSVLRIGGLSSVTAGLVSVLGWLLSPEPGLAWGGLVIVATILVVTAALAVRMGFAERARAARGLRRTCRVRVDPEGLQLGDGAIIPRERVAGLRVVSRDGHHAVRVRLDAGGETMLLDGLDEDEAALVAEQVRATLEVSDPAPR